MNRFVLDCSVSAAWCIPGERDDPRVAHYLTLLEAGEALVPAVWVAETAQVLISAEAAGRLESGDVAAALQLLARLPIVVVQANLAAIGRLYDTARRCDLAAGDASYLDLALERELPLASLDRGLRRAAKERGIRLI